MSMALHFDKVYSRNIHKDIEAKSKQAEKLTQDTIVCIWEIMRSMLQGIQKGNSSS